jgi:hypothetical protein
MGSGNGVSDFWVSVEIALDDWTLLDPSGVPLAREVTGGPQGTADGTGQFSSGQMAARTTAAAALWRQAARRGEACEGRLRLALTWR